MVVFVAATTGQGDEPDNMKVSEYIIDEVYQYLIVTEFLAVFVEEEFAA